MQPVEQEASPRPANPTGRRIAAGLIDVVVLAIVFGLMTWLFGSHETIHTTTTGNGFSTSGTNKRFNLTGWPFVFYLAIVATYYLASECLVRATPGKLLLGLRVVSANGEPLSLGRIVLRNVLRVVDGLPFLYLVGIITIAASKNHQRLGDMAASTHVSYESKPGGVSEAPITNSGEVSIS